MFILRSKWHLSRCAFMSFWAKQINHFSAIILNFDTTSCQLRKELCHRHNLWNSYFQYLKINRREICQTEVDPRSILVEIQMQFLPTGYRWNHSLFSICPFKDSYAQAWKLKVKGHKHLILQKTNHGNKDFTWEFQYFTVIVSMFPIFSQPKETMLGTKTFPETTLKIWKIFFKIRWKLTIH